MSELPVMVGRNREMALACTEIMHEFLTSKGANPEEVARAKTEINHWAKKLGFRPDLLAAAIIIQMVGPHVTHILDSFDVLDGGPMPEVGPTSQSDA